MKVLMISIDKKATDPHSLTFKRIKLQAELVEQLCVLVLRKGQALEQGNLKILCLGTNNPILRLFKGWQKGKELIKKCNPDVITTQDPFETGLVGRLLAGKRMGLNIQLHGDFFSNPFWRKERPLNKILYYLGLSNLKKSDSIRTVSVRIQDDLIKRGYDKEKIINVPIYVTWQDIGTQPAKFNLREKYAQFDFLALSLGRVEKVKHLDLLIRAWSEFINGNKNSGLIIVGDGREKDSLMKLVRELNLEKNVVFEPATDDVVSYYRGADCFVLCSWYEGWGRTIIEALACGCPVIMTDVGCAGEVVRNNENGLVVPVSNISAIFQALVYMKENTHIVQKWVGGFVRFLSGLPDWEQTAKLYLKSWQVAADKYKKYAQ